MSVTRQDIVELVRSLPLGKHDDQSRAAAAALEALLVHGLKGVVLADEVGCGKTYEALAVMTLLREDARLRGRPFGRVLILCKPSLVAKWSEEISAARADVGIGFPQYLSADCWRGARSFLERAHVIDHRARAEDLREGGMRGILLDGSFHARPGLYIVNQNLLAEARRAGQTLLKQIYRTRWDLLIVDEAHHHAKGNQPMLLFAPDEDLRNYRQGFGEGNFGKILALTATPFELAPREIVNLLALVRADPRELQLTEAALDAYVRHLDRFFDYRCRPPSDELRKAKVATLRKLRLRDATGDGAECGLEQMLRRYIIRNTKAGERRRYFFVNKKTGNDANYVMAEFRKLEDLKRRVAEATLIPFDGADALFYLSLRNVIQATTERRPDGTMHRSFVTVDMQQGLSSYPQIAASSLLQGSTAHEPTDDARRLRSIIDGWNHRRPSRLHPKVRAARDVITQIAREEMGVLCTSPHAFLSKVLVFNKAIEGTAEHLRKVIEPEIEKIFSEALERLLRDSGVGTREVLRTRVKLLVDGELAEMSRKLGAIARIPTPMDRRCCARGAVDHWFQSLPAR